MEEDNTSYKDSDVDSLELNQTLYQAVQGSERNETILNILEGGYEKEEVEDYPTEDDISEVSFEVDLRDYQKEIFKQIDEQWFGPRANKYGSIVFMATGSGKTFVAIMMI